MKTNLSIFVRYLFFCKTLFFFSAFSLLTGPANAQWVALNSGTNNIIAGIYFVDDNTGFAVEYGGGIRKTTDGGATWAPQFSGTTEILANVWFTNALHGIVVGDNSTILRTTDGGTNWIPVFCPVSAHLRGLWFVNNNVGYISGGDPGIYGVVLKTIDGGISWTDVSPVNPPAATQVMHGICFTTPNDGYACNWDGYIMRTSDGGSTWTTSATPVSNNHLMNIFFTDANNGYCVGGDYDVNNTSVILKTTDAGATWTALNNPHPTANFLLSVRFTDPNTGYVSGGNVQNNTGVILKTTDAGVTWTTENTIPNPPKRLAVLSLPSPAVGYVCGLDGVILKISDSTDSCDCPANLVQNPGFSDDAIPGELSFTGSTNNWDAASGTPDLSASIPYCNPMGIQMWGSQDVGEAICQTGLNLVPGKTYTVRFSAHFYLDPNLPPPAVQFVQFGFYASNGCANPFPTCTGCETIGTSVKINNTLYQTFTLPNWSPVGGSYNTLIVKALNTNNYPLIAFGRIDNICIQEDSVVATHDLLRSDGFRIFPNPNSGSFSVELPEPAKSDVTLRLIGLAGQVLMERQIEQGSTQQTMQADILPAGLYFLQVISEGKVSAVEKFMKQ